MPLVIKKRYTVRETYRITQLAARSALTTGRDQCDREASERIMLAVTEVNGCEICSYAHARRAIEAGVGNEEVRALLGGITDGVPDDELAGIAFGQHYADTRGHPDPQAWTDLVERYGQPQALCVLRAVRMIMWGNAMGIPLGSLRARLRGAPDPGSSLTYEVGTLVGGGLLTPVAVAHALVADLRIRSRGVSAT